MRVHLGTKRLHFQFGLFLFVFQLLHFKIFLHTKFVILSFKYKASDNKNT
jgi:hypothetical protein